MGLSYRVTRLPDDDESGLQWGVVELHEVGYNKGSRIVYRDDNEMGCVSFLELLHETIHHDVLQLPV